MFHIVRACLWSLLFPLSVGLLGLTSYRLHYTKHLNYGDILTTRRNFFDPIIVVLLVASVLALLFSLWFISAILGKMRNPLGKYITEHISLFIIWVLFLVGAAIMTHKWLHLRQCRKHFRQCRILETIKAFAWMCFIVTTLLLLFSFINMFRNKSSATDPLHGRNEYGTYPETRQTLTTNTTTTAYNPQPTTTTTAYINPQPTAHSAVVNAGNAGTTTTTGTVPQGTAHVAHTTNAEMTKVYTQEV